MRKTSDLVRALPAERGRVIKWGIGFPMTIDAPWQSRVVGIARIPGGSFPSTVELLGERIRRVTHAREARVDVVETERVASTMSRAIGFLPSAKASVKARVRCSENGKGVDRRSVNSARGSSAMTSAGSINSVSVACDAVSRLPGSVGESGRKKIADGGSGGGRFLCATG
jgi:hypothetical protein